MKPVLIFILTLLMYSTAGSQWSVVKRLPPQNYEVLNVDVPASTENRAPIIMTGQFIDDKIGWAATDNGSLLATTDGGQTWLVRTILPRVNQNAAFLLNAIFISFANRQDGWLVAEQRNVPTIFRTKTAGRTWTPVFRSKYRSSSFHSVWFLDAQNGWVVGEYADNDSRGGLILATKDGGVTWDPQFTGNGQESLLHEIRFADRWHGWAAGDNAILRTDDGGRTWKHQDVPCESYLFGIDVISSNEAWVVGSNDAVLHTVDTGSHWDKVPLPADLGDLWLNSVEFIDRDRGWIAGNNGIILSTIDGGKNWKNESTDKTSSYFWGFMHTKTQIFSFGNDGIILRRTL